MDVYICLYKFLWGGREKGRKEKRREGRRGKVKEGKKQKREKYS